MNAKLSLQVGAYSDGGWWIATVQTRYSDSGRALRPEVVAQACVSRAHVYRLALGAVTELLDDEERRRLAVERRPENASKPTAAKAHPTRGTAERAGAPQTSAVLPGQDALPF